MKTVLNLHLVTDSRHLAQCADELQTRLPADQWQVLAGLAAEIVARWEAAQGARVLLVQGSQVDRVMSDLAKAQPASR